METSIIDEKRGITIGLLNKISILPSSRQNNHTVVKNISSNRNTKDVADIIAQDIQISARVMKLANSIMFGTSKKISNLEKAIQTVGVDFILHTISTEPEAKFISTVAKTFNYNIWEKHSLLTASIFKYISGYLGLMDNNYLLGLFNNIGALIYAYHCPNEFNNFKNEHHKASVLVEKEQFGLSRQLASYYVLNNWKLPKEITEPIKNSNSPMLSSDQIITTNVLNLAACLSSDILKNNAWYTKFDLSNNLQDIFKISLNELNSLKHQVLTKFQLK